MECLVETANQAIRTFGANSLITRNSLIGNRTGIVLASGGNEVSRNESVGNDRRGLVIIGGVDNAIYQNDFYDNGINQVLSVDPLEVSFNGIGNYWGRNCGDRPLFRPGEDSNSVDVVDTFPFTMPVAHIPGDPRPPQCQ